MPIKSSALKIAREAAGWTQSDLARRLSVSRDQIAIWESGARNPSKRSIAALALEFGCCPDDLLNGDIPIDRIKISAASQRLVAQSHTARSAVLDHIPAQLVSALSAQQLVLVANAIDSAYHAGVLAASESGDTP